MTSVGRERERERERESGHCPSLGSAKGGPNSFSPNVNMCFLFRRMRPAPVCTPGRTVVASTLILKHLQQSKLSASWGDVSTEANQDINLTN